MTLQTLANKPVTLRNEDPFGPDVIEAIKAHGMEAYPLEACGVVADGVYHRCENKHPQPDRAFLIDPDVTSEFLHRGALQAIVHSHPDGPNFPTFDDQETQIAFDIPFGIVPVIGDKTNPNHAGDIIWWGDQLPIPPLEQRRFIWGVFHCWSLARDWWRLRGVTLPNFPCADTFITDGTSIFTDNVEAAGLVNLGKIGIEHLQVGDIVVGHIRGKFPNHCGVYIGDDWLLHHPADGASGRTELLRWWPHIDVVFRYEPSDAASARGTG